MIPNAKDFEQALVNEFINAEKRGGKSITIISRDLHEKVGGYSGGQHRMPTCCSVMTRMMISGDTILYKPQSGKGAKLKISYKLPRTSASINYSQIDRLPIKQKVNQTGGS
ncbi:hypothetical protein HY772_09070, partial [Candidatus Woesearchaeota archaeon]|nr:hypothetical protein [Candidatus Woesearchaeota archaeon]